MTLEQPIAAPQPPRRNRVRRVLLVSYHFPPVGGAGVQRPVKFVKYLREYGWHASVLVAANPSVPVFDDSLCEDIPTNTIIEPARTFEPGYRFKKNTAQSGVTNGTTTGFSLRRWISGSLRTAAHMVLQPDPQVLWLPDAYRRAMRLLNRTPHEAIMATAPPYSNLLLAARLKRATGLPLIVDFRDEWDLSSRYLENSHKDRFSHYVQERMQRSVLRSADAILATTRSSTNRLLDRARNAGSHAVGRCIYNGFDEDDFPSDQWHASGANHSGRLRLVYTGTLWNLTSAQPLAEAIEKLAVTDRSLLERLDLCFVGRRTPEQETWLDRMETAGCVVDRQPYCQHSRVLELMRSADALCLLLSSVEGTERVVPAKLFEYLASRKQVLAITPPGETADILRSVSPHSHFDPADTAGIANWLASRLQTEHAGQNHHDNFHEMDISTFSRRKQAGQLATLLDGLAAG